jgi:hypothetical protein
MDPLGLGRDLFRLIGYLYWGLAIGLICVALVKPKRLTFKFLWTAVIVGVFTSPLFFRSNEVNRINTAFKDSCSQVHSSIQPVASGSSQFVDHELVWLGLKSPPYATESIRYMLERKLTALELTYDPQFWTNLQTRDTTVPEPLPGIPRSPNSWGVQAGIYVRLTLQNAGHDSCKGFDKWSNEYPSQRWPWMQRLGMRPSQCIGFELVNQLQSRHGIYVERMIVETNGNNGALETHKYRLHDHQARADLGTAALTISSAYSHRDVLCGGDAIAKQLVAAIQSTPDPRYSTIDEVNLEKKPFPAAKNLSVEELRSRELNRGISLDRRVWTDARYERRESPGGSVSISLVGYDLISLWNDRLYRIPLYSDHVPKNQTPSAAGASANSVVVLIRSGYKSYDPGVLLEFSRVGEPIREQLISSEEWEALGLR